MHEQRERHSPRTGWRQVQMSSAHRAASGISAACGHSQRASRSMRACCGGALTREGQGLSTSAHANSAPARTLRWIRANTPCARVSPRLRGHHGPRSACVPVAVPDAVTSCPATSCPALGRARALHGPRMRAGRGSCLPRILLRTWRALGDPFRVRRSALQEQNNFEPRPVVKNGKIMFSLYRLFFFGITNMIGVDSCVF